MTARKTCLFFLADVVATAPELALIDRLAVRYDVLIRNGLVSNNFGPRLEAADAVAGTLPAEITAAIADYDDGNITPAVTSKPEAIYILPAAVDANVAAAAGTLQLMLVKAERNEDTDVITLTDITHGAESAWASGTPAKATIHADTGLVTGAAGGAGSTVITATVTYDTDKTITTTRTVTVT